MHILGRRLRDNKPVKQSLTAFFGIGQAMAARLIARFGIHETATVGSLTPNQVIAITSFLSSPNTAPIPPRLPLATLDYKPPAEDTRAPPPLPRSTLDDKSVRDPLFNIRIESELKREIRDNILHQRMINSYVGRRHAMGMPVRGQNTQTNAKTARKLNRVDRRIGDAV